MIKKDSNHDDAVQPDPVPHSRHDDPENVRSIHGRLDRFENHIDKATDKIDDLAKRVAGLEKEVAGGPSFPMWAKGVVATIVLQTFGAVWWASQVDTRVESMPQLEERLTSAFQAMRNRDTAVATMESELLRVRNEMDAIHKRTVEGTDDRWRKRDDEARMAEFGKYLASEIKRVEDKVTSLDTKVVGKTDQGWHRADHQLYAEKVDIQFHALEKRLIAQEERSKLRDTWWDKLRETGILKGKLN